MNYTLFYTNCFTEQMNDAFLKSNSQKYMIKSQFQFINLYFQSIFLLLLGHILGFS